MNLPIKIAVDVKEDSKTAQGFVEKFSAGCAALWGPLDKVLHAKADAVVRATDARSNIEVHEIQRRALQRVTVQEVRRQQQIETIVERAVSEAKQLPPPNAEPIDPDWLNRFFDEAKDISDSEMQGLLSKILAGEVVQPRSFSRRTLGVVREMGKEDLSAFKRITPAVFEAYRAAVPKFLLAEWFSAIDLYNADAIGLVHAESVNFQMDPGDAFTMCGHPFRCVGEMSVRAMLLTAAGTELLPLVRQSAGARSKQDIVDLWKRNKLTIEADE